MYTCMHILIFDMYARTDFFFWHITRPSRVHSTRTSSPCPRIRQAGITCGAPRASRIAQRGLPRSSRRYISVYVCMHASMVCMYIYMYVCVCVWGGGYVYMHTCVYVCVCMYMYVCAYVRVHVYVGVVWHSNVRTRYNQINKK